MQTKFNQCLSCLFNGCFRNNIVFQQAFESLKMEIWSTYSMNMFKNTSLNWGTILAVETSGNVTLKYKDMDFLVITSMINKLDNNLYLIHFKQKLNLSIRTFVFRPLGCPIQSMIIRTCHLSENLRRLIIWCFQTIVPNLSFVFSTLFPNQNMGK